MPPGAIRGRLSRAHVREDRNAHADETGRERANGADNKTDRSRVILENQKQNEYHDRDGADGHDLAIQIGLRAFLMAEEICRIRSLPAGNRLISTIKTKAASRPIAAHHIDKDTPE